MKIFQQKPVRSLAILIIFLALAWMVSACGQVKERPTPQAVLPQTNRIPQPVKVGMVLPRAGQVDDYLVNQAVRAFRDARENLWVDIRLLKPGELLNDEESLRFLGENDYDLVIAFSSMARAVREVAPEYPEVKFALLDAEVQGKNIISIKFKEEEGTFLAGALAALLTRTNQVGVVTTREPGTEAFISGFRAGVDYIAATEKKPVVFRMAYTPPDLPAVQQVAYAGYYAAALYDQQVDIIMPVPRKIADPVFKMAAAKGKFALGIDENLNWRQPGNICASVEKRVDLAVYGLMNEAAAKKLEPGLRKLGVAQGAVGLTDLSRGAVWIPPEVIVRMDAIRKKIAAGEIRVE